MSIREDLSAFLKANPDVSQAAIARALGVSAPVLTQWMGEYYHGDNDKVEAAVKAFLDLQRERAASPRLNIPYVQTSVAKKVFEVCKLCHLDGDIGVVYGEAGLGKTAGAKRYAETTRGVILIEVDLGYTAKTLFEEINQAIGVMTPGYLHSLFEDAVGKLKGTGRLLVIDEAEHLPYRALEMVRRLHDKTGIGIVMAGMPRLVTNLRGRREDYKQLYSRVGVVGQLTPLTNSDVEKIVAAALPSANGATPAFVEECRSNARHLTKLIQRTSRLAEINKAKITPQLVKKAAETLLI